MKLNSCCFVRAQALVALLFLLPSSLLAEPVTLAVSFPFESYVR